MANSIEKAHRSRTVVHMFVDQSVALVRLSFHESRLVWILHHNGEGKGLGQ